MKILLVEDDPDVSNIVRTGLEADFHSVETATDGADGSFMARTYDYDAIILDHSLPKKNGLAICKEIRTAGKTTPIIFLSVVDNIARKVEALSEGADDFVTKPFSMDELKARIRAVARRPAQFKASSLKVHDLSMNTDTQTVERGGQILRITRKEFVLLEYFMSHAGKVLSRPMILEHVWNADVDPFSNTIEAHVKNLRKKINTDGAQNLIINIPGRGYVMDIPENLKKFG